MAVIFEDFAGLLDQVADASSFSGGPRAVARRCVTPASESFCNTSLGGVVLVVAAALTRVLAGHVRLCNTCCVIMAEFQGL